MFRFTALQLRRRWPSTFSKPLRARVLVLVLVVAGWVALRIVSAAAAPHDGAGSNAARHLAEGASSASGLRLDRALDRDAASTPDRGWGVVRVTALVAVIAIAGAVALRARLRRSLPSSPVEPSRSVWARWLAPGATSRSMRVVQSSRLTARASVHVVRWDHKEWLLGCTDHGVTVVGQRAAPGTRPPEPGSEDDVVRAGAGASGCEGEP